MGSSMSKNTSNIVTNAIINTSSKIIEKQTADINDGQLISISDIKGNVNISDVYFTQTININMVNLMDILSEQKAQQFILEQIAQNAKSVTSGLNSLQFSYAVNNIDSLATALVTVSTKISENCNFSEKVEQDIILQRINGNVQIKKINLNQVNSILENCSQKAVSQNETIQQIIEKIDQKASASSIGISYLVILIVLSIGIPLGTSFVLKSIAPIFIILGGLGIYYYYYYSELDYNGYIVIDDDIKKTGDKKINLTLDQTNEFLKKSLEYKTVYWENYTIEKNNFYKKKSISEAWFFKNTINNFKQDQGNIFVIPNFLQGFGMPNSLEIKIKAEINDYYLDQTSGTYYKLLSNNEWKKINTISNLSDWGLSLPDNFIPRNKKDVYGEFINPLILQLYEFKNNTWVKTTKVNSYIEIFKTPNLPNTLIIKKYNKYILYLSIISIILGIVTLVISLNKKSNNVKKENKKL